MHLLRHHPGKPDPLQRWATYLIKPVNGTSLAVFRILFGSLLLWEVLRYFQHGWIEQYYIQPTFHFTYPFLDIVRPWPGHGMYIHFTIMGVLALLIALGLFYRAAAGLFFLAFAFVFLLDKAYYLNHFYLIVLLSFLLCLTPAHHVWSLDRWLFFRTRVPLAPWWSVLILRTQVFIVYFYAGLAKLNGDWLQGEPMGMWLAERTDFPIIGSAFTQKSMVLLFAYGGLLFDLSIGFLLAWRRSRLLAFSLAGVFHLINSQLFSIGIFPFLAFGATLIFAEPDCPQRALSNLGLFLARFGIPYQKSSVLHLPPGPIVSPSRQSSTAPAMLILIHLYLTVQLLIPLRHLLYPGNVNWTEEGHRFSWHMKLRDKKAILHIYITHPHTGETWEVSPAVDLSARQVDEMETRPDMVVQYAHYLAEKFSAAGQPHLIIRVDHRVSLNGRPYQPLIDPAVNLAEVSLGVGSADWLLPLTAPLYPQMSTTSESHRTHAVGAEIGVLATLCRQAFALCATFSGFSASTAQLLSQ